MNPVKIGTGKSFKGLAAYLLHDQEQAQTAARVGWTQSFNLDEAGPDRAWRLMAATAMSADQLKEAAGIKKGKAAVNTAYHFSLNFNPVDRPSEATQRAAVAGALAALGLDRHQALAVEHRDTAHSHIHVMVNLIDPETGMSAASKQRDSSAALLSNDTRKLSQWAHSFILEHGLTVTEGRLANANKRAAGEKVDARRKPRNVHEREKSEGQDRRLLWMKQQEAGRAHELAEASRRMTELHRQEWMAIRVAYHIEKGALRAVQDGRVPAEIAAVKDERKAHWSAMFMRQRSEVQDFERGEKSAIGRIWHSAAVVREKALAGDLLGGFVAAFSAADRRAIVERKHEKERARLSAEVKLEIAVRIKEAQHQNEQETARVRDGYMRACHELRKAQDTARQGLRQQWQDYNVRRREAFEKAKAPRRQQEQTPGRSLGRGLDQGFTPG